MKTVFAFVCLVVAASAQEFIKAGDIDSYPTWYHPEHLRYRRQLSIDSKSGDVTYGQRTSPIGQVFGTLDSRDESAFGKAYKHDVFDSRNRLDVTGYGANVIGPYGSENLFGGRVDYTGGHAKASLDVSRRTDGLTAVDAAVGGRWPLGRNGDFSLQGTYNREGLSREYGIRAGVSYRW